MADLTFRICPDCNVRTPIWGPMHDDSRCQRCGKPWHPDTLRLEKLARFIDRGVTEVLMFDKFALQTSPVTPDDLRAWIDAQTDNKDAS